MASLRLSGNWARTSIRTDLKTPHIRARPILCSNGARPGSCPKPLFLQRPFLHLLPRGAQIEIKKLLACQGECSASGTKFCRQVLHDGQLFNDNDARGDGHRCDAWPTFQGFCTRSSDRYKFGYRFWRRRRTWQRLFVHCGCHVLGDNFPADRVPCGDSCSFVVVKHALTKTCRSHRGRTKRP